MLMTSSRELFGAFRAEKLNKKTKEAEKQATRHRSNFRIYLSLLGKERSAFAKIFLTACITEILYLAVPFTTRHIIDGVLLDAASTAAQKGRTLVLIGGTLMVTLIAAQAIDFWRRFYTAVVNGRFVRSLRLRIFSHLMQLPLKQVHELKTGGIVSRLTSDAENLMGILQMALISPGVALLRITITIVILVQWHLPLALVACGFIPPLVYVSLIYILRVRPIYRSVSNDRSTQDARTSEVFAGIRAVKAYELQTKEKRRYNLTQSLMFRKNIFAALKESAIDGIWNFLIPATSLCIMVLGGFYFLRKEASIGDLVAFQMYSGMLLYPVWRMVFSLSQIQKSLASLERVIDMLQLDKEVNSGTLPMPQRIHTVNLYCLQFGYSQEKPVLKNISLAFKESRTYAIVGESGIGKTTLIDLLMRFYEPDRGSIAINGTDARQFDLTSYRRGIAIVTQDAILFDGTVRDNLLNGEEVPDKKALQEALLASDAQSFIKDLPQGIDTLIGERGFKLSGGQKHRLTLARALAKKSPILILDEATAHLDMLSEQRIRAQLSRIKKNRIIIIITHRLSTVSHADEIIVLNEKGVEAIGRHKALLKKSKTYRKLWQAQ